MFHNPRNNTRAHTHTYQLPLTLGLSSSNSAQTMDLILM